MQLLDEKGRLFGRVSIVDLGLALLILLAVGPAIYFAWEIRSAAPYISQVEPMETIISPNKNVPLVVWGKWFDSQGVVQLDNIPLITVAANTQRLDLMIPTEKIHPGAYQLTVTNKRGLFTTWKEPVRLFSEPPRITEVRQIPSKNKREVSIILFGTSFDKSCTIHVGTWTLKVTYKNSTCLEARGVLPPTTKAGSYPVQVTNSYGQSDQRNNAITLSPPPLPRPPPALPALPALPAPPVPAQPKIHVSEELIPVWVVCSFQEPEMRGRREWLKRGAITYYLEDHARPIAKIIRILDKTSIPKSDRSLILATLVLACNQDLLAQGVFLYGRGLRGYPPEGESVEISKRLPFKFQRLDIEGTVLTHPVPLKGTWEEYVDQ